MNESEPFDPDAFRSAGHRTVDALADYLASAGGREMPVLTGARPADLLAAWDRPFPSEPTGAGERDEALAELLRAILSHSNHLHHPGYVGHQVAVPLPVAALVEMTNALLNNGMAVFEMGQLQTVMETRVIEYLAGVLGFGSGSGGVLTHGGSVGNLTALLAARQAKAGYDVWSAGQETRMAVLVSEQAHYCIARSVQAMGWGAEGAWTVRTDERFRMDVGELAHAYERARAAGRQVIAVVASACSTATGRFDPLGEIAAFAAEHDLWLHVDGAHGASLALSRRHRGRLAGVERADSVVWDLHKMMGLPALNTALLFREKRRAYEAFAQEAGYLFDSKEPEEQWFNLGHRTLECTKRGMGVTAYCLLRVLGTDWFEAQVDALLERTEWLQDLLEEAPDFELACPAEANILCFRHLPKKALAGAELDAHQARIRAHVLDGGAFYVVQTRLRDAVWLRTTTMNPLTTHRDLEELVDAIRASAARR